MTENRIKLTQFLSKKLIASDVVKINNYIENIDEETLFTLLSVKLKTPLVGLLLSWFLGPYGVGAFYAGKRKFGIIQLVLLISYIVLAVLYVIFVLPLESFIASLMLVVLSTMILLFYIYGLIYTWIWVKQNNYNILMNILQGGNFK